MGYDSHELLKGTVVCTRDNWGTHCIEVRDELSRVIVVRAYMKPEDFAAALMSCTSPCEAEVGDSRYVGKRLETKHERVPYPTSIADESFEEMLARECRPLEVDGWRARIEGRNFNRIVMKGTDAPTYNVTFHWYVDPETGEPVDATSEEAKTDD